MSFSGLIKRKPGDWDCPSCGDLQFARNLACRKCGTPKGCSPDTASMAIGGSVQEHYFKEHMMRRGPIPDLDDDESEGTDKVSGATKPVAKKDPNAPKMLV